MMVTQQSSYPLALIFVFAAGCASSTDIHRSLGETNGAQTLSKATADNQEISTTADPAPNPTTLLAANTEQAVVGPIETAEAQSRADAETDLFPPNAQPGHCYARELKPAEFETSKERVLKTEASYRIEVIPAKYEWVEEEVITQEATTKLEVVPAKFKTITEQILVKPEGKKLVEIPAEYGVEEERVLDRPAHTIWKRSSGPVDGALQTRQDQSTGEIVCLVAVPASYKTVKRTILVTPARAEEIIIPAEYESITKVVEVEPASTREISIAAKTKMVKTRRLVTPAQEQKIEIPATYATVIKRTKVSEEELTWQEVLCQINMPEKVIADIQQKLKAEGYSSGAVDGILGANTLHAVNAYAKDKGLPVGKNYIATETVKSLGVSY